MLVVPRVSTHQRVVCSSALHTSCAQEFCCALDAKAFSHTRLKDTRAARENFSYPSEFFGLSRFVTCAIHYWRSSYDGLSQERKQRTNQKHHLHQDHRSDHYQWSDTSIIISVVEALHGLHRHQLNKVRERHLDNNFSSRASSGTYCCRSRTWRRRPKQ